jgi:two-component system phosphate regulon sensor histidine kinase PhoR
LKLWNLVNKIFTVEEYDIKEIKLFIEKINLYILIIDETDRFKKVNKKLKLNLEIDKNIWYIEIDKVQFTQVIDNLLNNALKFSDNKYPIINIKCYLEWKYIVIKIEDNWKWFKDIDINNIFWKYTTWTLSTVWIWLGLYLCKKIISMHNWIIKAKNSRKLWWACFILKIPVIHI